MCGSSSLIHSFVFLKWPMQVGGGGGGHSFLDTSLFSIYQYLLRGGGWKMRRIVVGMFGSLR